MKLTILTAVTIIALAAVAYFIFRPTHAKWRFHHHVVFQNYAGKTGQDADLIDAFTKALTDSANPIDAQQYKLKIGKNDWPPQGSQSPPEGAGQDSADVDLLKNNINVTQQISFKNIKSMKMFFDDTKLPEDP